MTLFAFRRPALIVPLRACGRPRFHYNFGYVKRLGPSGRQCAGVQGTGWQHAGCGEFYDENKFNREDLFRHITEQELRQAR